MQNSRQARVNYASEVAVDGACACGPRASTPAFGSSRIAGSICSNSGQWRAAAAVAMRASSKFRSSHSVSIA